MSVTIEETTAREVFDAASTLYRRVFGYSAPGAALNPLLLKALAANGGTAVAAIDDVGELLGFAYGFPGWVNQQSYAYSQATFVAPEAQGTGLGRRLKYAQRDQALRLGFTAMRWAFDPLLTKNAHFNLEVLGARGVMSIPSFYGVHGSDRLVVDWDLTADDFSARNGIHPKEVAPEPCAVTRSDDGTVWVTVPAQSAEIAPSVRNELRSELVAVLRRLESSGMRVAGIRPLTATTSAYLLEES